MNMIHTPDTIVAVHFINNRMHVATRWAVYKVIPRNGRQPRVKRTPLDPATLRMLCDNALENAGGSHGWIYNLTITEVSE